MNTAKTLFNMREGTSATVRKLLNEGGMRRRLQDIGLILGTEVECLGASPLGDPAAYLVRGAVIALRAQDAASVLIGPPSSCTPLPEGGARWAMAGSNS